MREPERWRVHMGSRTASMPYWTVDSDVVVPSKSARKSAQFSAGVHDAPAVCTGLLPEFLVPFENPHAEIKPGRCRPQGSAADDVPRRHYGRLERLSTAAFGPVAAWHGGHPRLQ